MCHYLHAYANTSPNNEDMKEECYRKIEGVDKTHNILRNSKNFFSIFTQIWISVVGYLIVICTNLHDF